MKRRAVQLSRARARAALNLAAGVLNHEDDLCQLERPGDFNEHLNGDATTTVERDQWVEWVALAREACGEKGGQQ